MEFYTKTETHSDVWITPKYIVDALGPFDLDPCCPNIMPYKTATLTYSLERGENGLHLPWYGKVWLNPPYSNWVAFLKRLKEHGNGIAILFVRAETQGFFDHIWDGAIGFLFLKRRVKFLRADGQKAMSATAASVLIAYGEWNAQVLQNANLEGKFLYNLKKSR